MGTDGAQRPGMFTGQRHEEFPASDVRLHELLNGLHGRPVDPPVQVKRVRRRNAAPFAIGFAFQGFIVQLDLL
mgnify:CR=1 FL=1